MNSKSFIDSWFLYCVYIIWGHYIAWGSHFRAADNYHIAGVIPSNSNMTIGFSQNWSQSMELVDSRYIYQVLPRYVYHEWSSGWFQPCQGWLFPRGLSRCYEPILYPHKHKSTADKALIVHFFFYFSYDMRFYFLITPLYWALSGGLFRAADVHLKTGVIPSNFKYDNLSSRNWL